MMHPGAPRHKRDENRCVISMSENGEYCAAIGARLRPWNSIQTLASSLSEPVIAALTDGSM
jgi:hypothetical protein